jgi:hypothetical protein
MHEVGGLGHVQATRAEEQQHRGGDDGEQDVIHRLHADLLKETPVKARGNRGPSRRHGTQHAPPLLGRVRF